MHFYSAEWLRYEARVLLCEEAPLRSTSATLRSGSATKHEQLLTSQSHSIRILLYEKQKDFKKNIKTSFCYLEKKKILA